jgi:hypothetical protein
MDFRRELFFPPPALDDNSVLVDGRRIRDFWAQWQHEPSPTQEFMRFRARLLRVADDIWREYLQAY